MLIPKKINLNISYNKRKDHGVKLCYGLLPNFKGVKHLYKDLMNFEISIIMYLFL